MKESFTPKIIEKEQFVDFFKPKIETEEEFWDVLIDAKNNLNSLENYAKNDHITQKDFLDAYKEIEDEFLDFKTYLKKSEIELPENFKHNENVKNLIATYDDLVKKIKTVRSKDDYMKLLPELSKIPTKPFDLKIYNKEGDE